jgi:hypothetical protein
MTSVTVEAPGDLGRHPEVLSNHLLLAVLRNRE